MSVKIPLELVMIVDELVKAGLFASRSEFVRCAMVGFLMKTAVPNS